MKTKYEVGYETFRRANRGISRWSTKVFETQWEAVKFKNEMVEKYDLGSYIHEVWPKIENAKDKDLARAKKTVLKGVDNFFKTYNYE